MKRAPWISLLLLAITAGPVMAAPVPPGPAGSRVAAGSSVGNLVARRDAVRHKMARLEREISQMAVHPPKGVSDIQRREWQVKLDGRRRELVGLGRLERRLTRAIRWGGR